MVLNVGSAAGPGLLVTIDHHGSDALISSGIAISAISKTASAIRGESEVVDGIAGFTKARQADRAGVVGISKNGPGVRGHRRRRPPRDSMGPPLMILAPAREWSERPGRAEQA
jgi:hypothetical protein